MFSMKEIEANFLWRIKTRKTITEVRDLEREMSRFYDEETIKNMVGHHFDKLRNTALIMAENGGFGKNNKAARKKRSANAY